MEEKTNEKIYPTVGELSKRYTKLTFTQAANWQNANTSFYWVNFEYPQYHGHTDWELVIVLNDEILHKINGTEKILTMGTACLIGPKDSHALFYPGRKKNQFQEQTQKYCLKLLFQKQLQKKMLMLWQLQKQKACSAPLMMQHWKQSLKAL